MPDSYSVPMRSSAPAGSPTRYTDPQTIDNLLKSSDPETVAESGRSYQKFALVYEKIASELISLGSDLHEAWTGKDATAVQSQLREVWSAAVTVHKIASAFGVAVERHGSESLAWYKYNKPPSAGLAEAQSWMAGANERVAQSWNSLPPDLATTLPPAASVDEHTPAMLDPAGEYGGSSESSAVGGTLGVREPDKADLPGGATHRTTHGSVSRLAGLPPTGTGGLPSGEIGLPTAGPAGLDPGGTVFPSATGPISAPGLVGGFPPFGRNDLGGRQPASVDPAGPRGPCATTLSSEAEATEANAVTRAGTGPILGGDAGRKERERTRKTWLAEDEDVWTGDLQSAPPLIGSGSGIKPPERETSPVEVEIDLTGDDVDLAGILDSLHASRPEDPAAEIAELRAKLERLERQVQAEARTMNPAAEETSNPDWITGGDG